MTITRAVPTQNIGNMLNGSGLMFLRDKPQDVGLFHKTAGIFRPHEVRKGIVHIKCGHIAMNHHADKRPAKHVIDLHGSRAIINHLCGGQNSTTIFPLNGFIADFHPDRRPVSPNVIDLLPAVKASAALIVFGKFGGFMVKTGRDILAHVGCGHEILDVPTAKHLGIGIVDVHGLKVLMDNNPYA